MPSKRENNLQRDRFAERCGMIGSASVAFVHNDHGNKMLIVQVIDFFGICYEGVTGARSTLQADNKTSQAFLYMSNEP